MLVLSREKNQKIFCLVNPAVMARLAQENKQLEISFLVVEVRGDKVRIGIDAPRDVVVHREEVLDAIRKEAAGEIDSPD